MIDQIQDALAGGQNGVLASRPYISNTGKNAGKLVVVANTGTDSQGNPIYVERVISANANETSLRMYDWTDIDRKVVESAQQRLVIVDDLIQSGFVYNAGDLGTIVSEWDAVSELTDAVVSIDGEVVANKDRQEYQADGVVIPVIHKDFHISKRQMLASRRNGGDIDTSHAAAAARTVARKSENIVFAGHNISAKGRNNVRHSIYGLTNHPSRATENLTNWRSASVTTETIFADILKMIKKLEKDKRTIGPYRLYVPTDVMYRFREDFKDGVNGTLFDRVMAIDEIESIKASDQIASNAAVLVQWLTSTIDLAMISNIQTLQWQSPSGWTENFEVFACWAPRIKADYDGNLGVCHGTISAS